MAAKRRKVDSEKREFNSDWTRDFAFIHCKKANLPRCLICQDTVAVFKRENVKRHNRRHAEFERQFPPGTEKRREELLRLERCLNKEQETMSRFTTIQERATIASYKVCWRLAKHMKPYSDAAIVKECIADAIESVIPNPATQKQILQQVKDIPLSNDTATRCEKSSAAVVVMLKKRLNESQFYSIAVDESTDKTDSAQLMVYIRYYWKDEFHEDVLGIHTMEGRTTGADLHQGVTSVLNAFEIDMTKLTSITTDGAPAMIGPDQGMVFRLKSQCPNIIHYHCLIHQSVLCSKLGDRYRDNMLTIMKLVNYLRSTSALRHRQLKTFLHEVGGQYDDLLLHNNVRWLSQGKVIARFWSVRTCLEEEVFLEEDCSAKAEHFKEYLDDPENMDTVAFLVDVTEHLNTLNIKLQGKGHTICRLMSEINSFMAKIDLFIRDFSTQKIFFSTLKKFEADQDVLVNHDAFLNNLKENFASRFQEFKLDRVVLSGVADPFSIQDPLDFSSKAHVVFETIDVARVASEVVDLQQDVTVVHERPTKDVTSFWKNATSVPALKKLAIRVLSMFGSTYVCESGFSNMNNYIKNKFRSTLTNDHLHQLIRIALTDITPDFSAIAKSSVCHTSH